MAYTVTGGMKSEPYANLPVIEPGCGVGVGTGEEDAVGVAVAVGMGAITAVVGCPLTA